VDCHDTFDLSGLDYDWTIAGVESKRQTGEACSSNWQEASRTEQVLLTLTITKQNLKLFSQNKRIHVLRGTNKTAIGELPALWSYLLPTKLSVVPISKTQFALQGPNAETIDYVSVQGPGLFGDPIGVAAGADSVLVSIDQPPNEKPSIAGLSVNGRVVTITGQAFGLIQGKGRVTFTDPAEKSMPLTVDCWSNESITVTIPGTTAVMGNLAVVTNPGTDNGTSNAKTLTVGVGKATDDPACPKDPTIGATYAVLPLLSLGNGPDGRTQYLPLNVTDTQGKALTFSIPDQSKTSNSSNQDSGANGATETITITKKTSGGTQPPAQGNAPGQPQKPIPGNQGGTQSQPTSAVSPSKR
jgi:hypothetical protein